MRVLFAPVVRRGMGTGHLRRTAELARRMGPGAALLVEGCRQEFGLGPPELLSALGIAEQGLRCLEGLPADEPWDLVVLDRRATARAELERFSGIPILGLDEGGEARRYATYLIDLLPTPPNLSAPNRSCPGLLFLPAAGNARGDRGSSRQRMLLSFGGEDPADLTSRMVGTLVKRLGVPAGQLTVVEGGLFSRGQWPEGVEVLHRPQRLAELLAEYRLVFTSFGLTTFEALAAGVPVVNLNPSRYHRRLSRAAGIPEVGIRRPRTAALRRVLSDPASRTPTRSYPAESFRPVEDPARFFAGLRPDGPPRCPVCGTAGNPAAARFANRSYFDCRGCKVTYLVGFGLVPRSYDRDYFGEEYRRQYGRTYLEDFESIKAAGRRRLEVIQGLLRRGRAGPRAAAAPGPRLLDVGCAYGPFLAAAREAGFRGEGLDVSEAAVEHVRGTLGLPCGLGDFESLEPGPWAPGSLDVVSMWYVIEHFRNPAAVLERAAVLLRPGGVLAFSTPNRAGVSGRRDREAFLRGSPEDHRTVWDPRTARRAMKRFGFRPAVTVITGHHPERFPRVGGSPAGGPSRRQRGRLRLLGLFSRILRLGDTFELYAVKEGERG